MKITELLARRTDLSSFLVHLTRDRGTPTTTAKQNLISIIQGNKIEARNPYGIAYRKLEESGLSTNSQRVVCFTETPLEHVNLLTGEIEDRTYKFGRYGIAITRKQGRLRCVNPVWYLDITPSGGFKDWLTNPVNSLIRAAIGTGNFDLQHIARLTPFIEQMGKGIRAEDGQPYKKEFWWEREWRHCGDFTLPPNYIILCATEDITEIIEATGEPDLPFVDPLWSLEMIIGCLAGIPADEWVRSRETPHEVPRSHRTDPLCEHSLRTAVDIRLAPHRHDIRLR